MKTISDNKLVAFALGKQQKSRFQKAREEKEAKKRLDEQEAAREYDSFVASFVDEDGSSKIFLRGGQVNSTTTDTSRSAVGAIYKPERQQHLTGKSDANCEVIYSLQSHYPCLPLTSPVVILMTLVPPFLPSSDGRLLGAHRAAQTAPRHRGVRAAGRLMTSSVSSSASTSREIASMAARIALWRGVGTRTGVGLQVRLFSSPQMRCADPSTTETPTPPIYI